MWALGDVLMVLRVGIEDGGICNFKFSCLDSISMSEEGEVLYSRFVVTLFDANISGIALDVEIPTLEETLLI